MEDTLKVGIIIKHSERRSLNPCFNGRYSQSVKSRFLVLVVRES